MAEEEPEKEDQPKGEGGKQSKDLDTVTDYVEQKEMDEGKAKQAMSMMLKKSEGAEVDSADATREKELASVKVEPGDVKVIMKEFEVDKDRAERALREQKGDLVAALEALVAT